MSIVPSSWNSDDVYPMPTGVLKCECCGIEGAHFHRISEDICDEDKLLCENCAENMEAQI